MEGSGYRKPPALVRRADGQTIQLTRCSTSCSRPSTAAGAYDEIAAEVSARSGGSVSAGQRPHLVDDKLRPLGLLQLADGSEPEVRSPNPLLGLRFRYAVTDPERTRRLTAPVRRAVQPARRGRRRRGVPGRLLVGALRKGLASATYEAFDARAAAAGLRWSPCCRPASTSSATPPPPAAAARRRARWAPGLYLVWPAFYTDVTDSYRLGRGGRLRTDLGGLYFNAIVARRHHRRLVGHRLGRAAAGRRHPDPADGAAARCRWCASTATTCSPTSPACPTSSSGSGPPCSACCRGAGSDPEAPALKPWARAVVTLWVLVVVPLLLFSLVLMVLVPAAAARHRVGEPAEAAGPARRPAWASGDVLEACRPRAGNRRRRAARAGRRSTSCSGWSGRSRPASGEDPGPGRCGAAPPWLPSRRFCRAGLGLVARRGTATARCSPTSAGRSPMPPPRSVRPAPDRPARGPAGQTVRALAGRCGAAHAGEAAAEPGAGARGGTAAATSPPAPSGRPGPVVGLPLRQARRPRGGRQPGARRQHHGRLRHYDVAFALVWAEDGTGGHPTRPTPSPAARTARRWPSASRWS